MYGCIKFRRSGGLGKVAGEVKVTYTPRLTESYFLFTPFCWNAEIQVTILQCVADEFREYVAVSSENAFWLFLVEVTHTPWLTKSYCVSIPFCRSAGIEVMWQGSFDRRYGSFNIWQGSFEIRSGSVDMWQGSFAEDAELF